MDLKYFDVCCASRKRDPKETTGDEEMTLIGVGSMYVCRCSSAGRQNLLGGYLL